MAQLTKFIDNPAKAVQDILDVCKKSKLQTEILIDPPEQFQVVLTLNYLDITCDFALNCGSLYIKNDGELIKLLEDFIMLFDGKSSNAKIIASDKTDSEYLYIGPIVDSIMILDIETDGIKNENVIQIAYCICNQDLDVVRRVNILINNGNGAVDYYRRFTIQQIKKDGITPASAIKILIEDLKYCKAIVGHNIKSFDSRVLIGYAKSIGFEICFPRIIDTMTETATLLNLKNKSGGRKQPRLSELYKYLYGTDVDESHTHEGDYDVHITQMCLVRLVEMDIIKL